MDVRTNEPDEEVPPLSFDSDEEDGGDMPLEPSDDDASDISAPVFDPFKEALKTPYRSPYGDSMTSIYNETQFKDVSKLVDIFNKDAPSYVKACCEQGNKTACIASAVVCGALQPVPPPMIVLCGANMDSVGEFHSKLSAMLEPYKVRGIVETKYFGKNDAIDDFFDSHLTVNGFRCGKVVPVLKAQHDRLEKLRERLTTAGVRDVVMIIDEFDAVMTVSADDKTRVNRDRLLYDLMTGTDGRLCSPGAIVRKIVPVSATNMGTLLWHIQTRTPFVADVVDLETSIANGYTTSRDLRPIQDDAGNDVFMETSRVETTQNGRRRTVKLSTQDKLASRPFRMTMEKFSRDTRAFGMMQVATTPYTNSTRENHTNMRQVAARIDGIFRGQNGGRNDKLAILIVTGKGVDMMGGAAAGINVPDRRFGISEAIRMIEALRDPQVGGRSPPTTPLESCLYGFAAAQVIGLPARSRPNARRTCLQRSKRGLKGGPPPPLRRSRSSSSAWRASCGRRRPEARCTSSRTSSASRRTACRRPTSTSSWRAAAARPVPCARSAATTA